MTVPPEREQEIRELGKYVAGYAGADAIHDLLALLDEARRERDEAKAEIGRLTRLDSDAWAKAFGVATAKALGPNERAEIREQFLAAWRDRDKEQP